MPAFKDITGQKFNRLTAIEYKGEGKWLFRCECGGEIILPSSRVKIGGTKSCGCLKKELDKKLIRHGMYKHPSYQVWADMKQRCKNPHIRNYKNYGGRGVKVCDEWENFENFCKWADENGYVPGCGLSIDRIDVNGDYCPGNCRWAKKEVQERNKRNNVMITFNGETKCAQDWSHEFGLARSALAKRINGKSQEEVMKIMEHYLKNTNNLLPEGKFGEWKSVEDENPGDGEKVLCVGKNGGMDICTYRATNGEGKYIQAKNAHFYPVYWIRIPKRPRVYHESYNRTK